MAGIKPLLVGIMLAGLFAFALITGGIMVGTTNNANQNIGDSEALSSYKNNLETALLQSEINANSSIEAIGESPITEIQGSFIFDAISGVWKNLKTIPVTIYNLTFGEAKTHIFGETFNPVFAIVGAILIMLIIFGVIKMITSGQDE